MKHEGGSDEPKKHALSSDVAPHRAAKVRPEVADD
jgi:hypothetical protein